MQHHKKTRNKSTKNHEKHGKPHESSLGKTTKQGYTLPTCTHSSPWQSTRRPTLHSLDASPQDAPNNGDGSTPSAPQEQLPHYSEDWAPNHLTEEAAGDEVVYAAWCAPCLRRGRFRVLVVRGSRPGRHASSVLSVPRAFAHLALGWAAYTPQCRPPPRTLIDHPCSGMWAAWCAAPEDGQT